MWKKEGLLSGLGSSSVSRALVCLCSILGAQVILPVEESGAAGGSDVQSHPQLRRVQG